ncbi:hypothetical protein CgunFtcFv8_001439 [Champsocephalus gunnari]|uniref:Uncharacterized protein n=1 Tax=Champsocephalus gunnari TaxID=52237 RepID=A0AAN8CKV3_CHAGU|nr:hypothetical protein CgunFtcFv8_001439 [Champsocephalus gunnari]
MNVYVAGYRAPARRSKWVRGRRASFGISCFTDQQSRDVGGDQAGRSRGFRVGNTVTSDLRPSARQRAAGGGVAPLNPA